MFMNNFCFVYFNKLLTRFQLLICSKINYKIQILVFHLNEPISLIIDHPEAESRRKCLSEVDMTHKIGFGAKRKVKKGLFTTKCNSICFKDNCTWNIFESTNYFIVLVTIPGCFYHITVLSVFTSCSHNLANSTKFGIYREYI